ncbi:mechanosensitive ion channel domain-containing protein [Sulfurovum sp. CS9]|uniref:mechanosensitive ion channel domain-containing protein n=1 Tax=Sulfurovum sp. CS9 TaxID=3391146 RepID=UPI0039ED7428
MQNLLRIMLMTALLSLVGTQWSAGAEEKNSQMILTVNPEVLKSKIKEVETISLDDESKKDLTGLYHKALANIEKARFYATDAESFSEAQKTAPAETEKLLNALKEKEKVLPEKILKVLEKTTLSELEQQEQKEKADLSAVEAKLSDLNNRLVIQSRRPSIARERLIVLKRRLETSITKRKSAAPEGEPAVMIQARNWIQETQTFALSSEIKMLGRELLSYQKRMEVLNAKQDVTESNVKYITTRVRLIEDLLSKRRLAEVEQVQQQVKTTKEESRDKHSLVRKLAEQNVALGKELKTSTLDLERASAEDDQRRASAKRIGEELSSIKQKLEIAGMSQALGGILIQQHRLLPKLPAMRSETSQLKQLIASSGLRQVQYTEEHRRLRDIEAYLTDFMQDMPQKEVDRIYTELKELALRRQGLLNKAIATEASYLSALGELDLAQRQLINVVEAYDNFLGKHLLWIRSTEPVSLSLFKNLSQEIELMLSPSKWMEVGNVLLGQLKAKPLVTILVLILVFLALMRRYFLRAAVATGEKIGHIRTDSFGYTIQALVWTAFASAPLPLLFLVTGWQLSLVPEATEFSNAVAAGLLRISRAFFALMYLADLAIPGGLVVKHFKWPANTAAKLHRELRLLMVLIMPTTFITIHSITLDKVGLTMLSLLFTIGSVGLFIFRTFTPRGGVLANFFVENSTNLLVRLRSVWGSLLIVYIISLVVLVLLGYIYTGITLTHNLINTILMIYPLVLLHGLLARWLLLVGLRLKFQAILARREEVRMAKETMEKSRESASDRNEYTLKIDEPEIDLTALDSKSRKLLNTAILFAGVIGLWFIWSPILPAFSILDDISLWNSVVIVDGVETVVPITLTNLLLAIIVGIITTVSARGLPALLEFMLLQSAEITVGGRYTATTLLRYVIVGIGTVLFFDILGGKWSQIQWLVAALGVGIGFGLQEIVANFISGLIILFERPIRVGDTVTVGTTTGVVTRIMIRATTITTWDRQELLVPNKEFITARLLNWTLSDPIIRIVIPVGIAYGSDVPKAMELLKEAANEHNSVLDSPVPSVTFESFDDNALKLYLRAFLPSVDNRVEVVTDLHGAINHKFNEAGIAIAFPQRDVHFDTSKPIDIRVHSEKDKERS